MILIEQMILIIYLVVGMLALLSMILSRGEKSMNFFSICHALSYLLISILVVIYEKLPMFFTESRLFFIDTFALYEVVIASFIFFLVAIYLRGYMRLMIGNKELNPKNIRLFYCGFSLLLMSTVFAFFSNNLALFWIFLELTTLFSVLLITLLNAKENIVAGLHYIFIVSPAMVFTFIGLIILYVATQSAGVASINWFDIMHTTGLLQSRILEVSFIFIFIGFAAKSGIVPFHNWLPKAYSAAPSPVTVLMSAVVSSLGMYGIIRVFAIIGHTAALSKISWLLIIFGMVSVAVASFVMLQKKNVKMMLAFSSIEQAGIILIALGIATKTSIFWALLYVTFHSLIKALLFFSAGIINSQYESNNLESISDMIRLQPVASLGLIVGSLAIIGLPPFLLFAPKFFILAELGRHSIILLGLLLFFILIAVSAFAILMTKLFSNVTKDEKNIKIKKFILPASMKFTIILLIILVIALGLYMPPGLQHVINSIVAQLGF